jgi:hypothetical protein
MATPDHYCFCELAPLYALDMVTSEERLWVEQQLQDCPELEAEILGYQIAAAAIPYSAPPEPLSDNLKAQLWERLDLSESEPDLPLDLPEPEVEIPSTVPAFLTVRSQELRWRSQGIPGVTVAKLHTDRVLRQIVGLLRAEPGTYYPHHRHTSVEEIYMLSGDLVIGDQVYGVGDYIRSYPDSTHTPYTHSGCMFFFRTSMDDDYSEPELVGAM